MVKKWKQDIHKTVACLEGRAEEEDEAMSTGRLSSIGSWADEVEEEEISRSRMSSSSSDQVCRWNSEITGDGMCNSLFIYHRDWEILCTTVQMSPSPR